MVSPVIFQPVDMTQNLARAEERKWLEMPFVEVMSDGRLNNWSFTAPNHYFMARQYGVSYALRVVKHLRRYQRHDHLDITWRLSDVVRDFGAGDRWSGAEFAFLQSLASQIASGFIEEGGDIAAVYSSGSEALN